MTYNNIIINYYFQLSFIVTNIIIFQNTVYELISLI